MRFENRKLAADFGVLADLRVAGHRFNGAVGGVYPQRVATAFPLQPATVGLQVSQ